MGTYSSQYPAHGSLGWDPALQAILDSLDARALALEASAALAVQPITDTSVKSANYTAAVGERVLCYAGGSPFTVTLPTAPANGKVVRVRHRDGAALITVVPGGSDKFNIGGAPGGTSDLLPMPDEEHTYTYNATGACWWVTTSVTVPQMDLRYAPFGSSYKSQVFGSTETVRTGLDLVPGGIPITAPVTLTAVRMGLKKPTVGGTQVWDIVLDRNGVRTVLASPSFASGARGVVVNSLSVALTPATNDLILVQCSGANGATYAGDGPTVQLQYGGSLAIPTAPSINTGLAATPGSSTIGLSWTPGAGAFSHLIRRDGIPYDVTSVSTYTDNGPPGTATGVSGTHIYQVDALVPYNITNYGTGVTSSTGYLYYPLVAQNLSALNNDFAVTLGTNTSPAPTVAVDANGILTMTSATVGTNNTQDRCNYQWIKDSTVAGTPPGANHKAFTRSWLFGFGTSGAIADLYFNAPAWVSLATSVTTYVQIEINPTVYRVAMKAPTFNSGSFYIMTASTTSPVQATTVGNSSGNINWPTTVTVDAAKGHLYGLKVDVTPVNIGTGAQDINIYMGTQSQFLANTLPLINTITLTAAQRTALDASLSTGGTHYVTMLGAQSTGLAETYFEQSLTINPDI